MTWIDDHVDQLNKLRSRNSAVANGAEGIFEELWKEIVSLSKEAAAKGLRVRTNGSAFDRIVGKSSYPILLDPRNEKQLRISLDKQRELISACGPDQTIDLSIDLCDDGVVCLKYKDKRIRIEEAAKLILEPFFFSELQFKDNS